MNLEAAQIEYSVGINLFLKLSLFPGGNRKHYKTIPIALSDTLPLFCGSRLIKFCRTSIYTK